MQVLVNPKEKILSLANEMDDVQLSEIAHFMQFLQLKTNNETFDLVKASESSLAFWDNEEDSVWDNV
jgi:hypothetical protein